MSTFTVFVPAPESAVSHVIRRGSGIVGRVPGIADPPGSLVQVDYEGDLYNASNLVTFADRVRRAYYRQVESYPTIARMYVPDYELIRIGWFDPDEGVVHCACPKKLAEWLGVDEVHTRQLRCSS